MFPDPESCDPSLWTFDTLMPSQEEAQQETQRELASDPVDFFDGEAATRVEASSEASADKQVAEWEEPKQQRPQQQRPQSSDDAVVVDWSSHVNMVEEEGNDAPWLSSSATSIGTESTQMDPPLDGTLQMDEFLGFIPQECGDMVVSGTTMDVLAFDAEIERWSGNSGTRTPPPPGLDDDPTEQQPDDTLNSDRLFSERNFKKGTSGLSERGRGAFAAATICLLQRLEAAAGHVHAIRGGAHVDRWQLNRMPGRTDALLHFVNAVLVSMLGLKGFSSWRALARSLGDTRDYLPPRHWRCLELKGGGVSEATKQPWQSYQARAGHFDMLAEELETFLLTCGDLLTHTQTGAGAQQKGDAPSVPPASRQEQFAAKRMAALNTAAADQSVLNSSDIARPGPPEGYQTKAEVHASLKEIWSEVLMVLPKIAPSPPSTRRRGTPSSKRKASSGGKAKGEMHKSTSGPVRTKGKAKAKPRPSSSPPSATKPAAVRPAAKPAAAKSAAVETAAKAATALPVTEPPPRKSRSGRAVTMPSWMQSDSAFVTGKVMNDVFHQSKGLVPPAKKRRRRRAAVGAAAAAAMFG